MAAGNAVLPVATLGWNTATASVAQYRNALATITSCRMSAARSVGASRPNHGLERTLGKPEGSLIPTNLSLQFDEARV